MILEIYLNGKANNFFEVDKKLKALIKEASELGIGLEEMEQLLKQSYPKANNQETK